VDSISNKQEQIFWREFLCLWVTAVAVNALSLSLNHLPLAGLARQLFIPFHSQSVVVMLIAVIAQNSINLAIFVGVGLVAAHRVGLGAPVLEAWFRGEPVGPHLRGPVIPILLTALLFVGCTALSNSSVFHPNRRQDAIAAFEIMKSPARPKLIEQIEKLGLVGTKPDTTVSRAISYLDGALGGELSARLFEVSVIVLLLVQIFGKPGTATDRKFLLAAVLIVTVISTSTYLMRQHENTQMFSDVFKSFGLSLRADPYWLVAARTSLSIAPTSLAFGLIYVRYGIESAIAANFAAAVLAALFATFLTYILV
jgi:hypothetical protein